MTETGFRAMARRCCEVADEHAGGRCAAILEGGYDLHAIRDSAAAVIDELRGERPPLDLPRAAPAAAALLRQVRAAQSDFWSL